MTFRPLAYFIVLAAILVVAFGWSPKTCANPPQKPNVVLIVCDDLNDYITGIPGEAGHPQAKTPNCDRLAKSGVAFRHAYSNNPICAPSRSSFLTGVYPHTSGNFFFDKWYENPVLKNSKTIMEHFRDNGYHVAGSGKLMHHFRPEVWSEFKHKADYGPFVYDGKKNIAHPAVPKPFRDIGAIDGSFGPLERLTYSNDDDPRNGWIYGDGTEFKPMRSESSDDRDPTPDERNAQWAAERLAQFAAEDSDKPFFLGVGFLRPHTPLHVPRKYFDMFPIESVQLPLIKKGDVKDTYLPKVTYPNQKGWKYSRLLGESYSDREAGLRAFTQAYLASVAAVDDCIGQVIDAIDNSPLKDHTIIVLTSDHGWCMGQKDFLFKNNLWEEASRVPFVVRAPGVAQPGGVAENPISLVDLYPTLVDLCGLTGDTRKNEQGAPLDGHSVRPFLEDPTSGAWRGPDGALTMVKAYPKNGISEEATLTKPEAQHLSYRTRRWRYILYNNGSEELYDHDNDPREWTNLAGDPAYAKTLKRLKTSLLNQVMGSRTK
jgi:arylsulfatase A-like enzyme